MADYVWISLPCWVRSLSSREQAACARSCSTNATPARKPERELKREGWKVRTYIRALYMSVWYFRKHNFQIFVPTSFCRCDVCGLSIGKISRGRRSWSIGCVTLPFPSTCGRGHVRLQHCQELRSVAVLFSRQQHRQFDIMAEVAEPAKGLTYLTCINYLFSEHRWSYFCFSHTQVYVLYLCIPPLVG